MKTRTCEKADDTMDVTEYSPSVHPGSVSVPKRSGLDDRGSLQLSDAIIDLAPNIIVGLGRNAEILVFNRYAEQITGYRAEEVIGRPWIETFIPGKMRDEISRVWACVVREKAIAHHHENTIITKGGERRLIAWSNMVLTENGTLKMVISIGQDVTERHRAEEAMQASEERYRSLFETTHEAIGASGPDGRIISANPAMARILGLENPEMLIGVPAVDLYANPDDRTEFFKELKTTGYVENFELTLVKQNGRRQLLHILGNANLYKNESRNIQRIDFVFSDITERKKAEKALQESEEKYRTITENINIGIYRNTPGPHGRFIEANPAIASMFGYDNREEFVNVNVSELYQDPNRRQMFNGKMLESGFVKSEEILLKRKDGKPFWGSVTAVAVCDERGKVKYYDGVIEDITERKRSEEALQESEEKFRTLADQSPNMIFINKNGKVVYANPKCEQVLDYTREEFCSPDFDFLSIISPEFHEIVKASFAKHAQGIDVSPYEYTLVSKEGKRIDAILASKLIDYEGGKAILGTVTDISERKSAEEELKQSLEKLESLLAGIVNTMSITVETRDQYTAGHQRRVAALARVIAEEMGLTEEQSKSIHMAALIHDIGKISIPAEILSKPTRLSEVEYSIIKTHPQVGYDILKGIDFPWPIAEIVLKHHERIDGSGYPQGLAGDEIPTEAKILSVADVVEAMASHRPYRAALGIGKALEEITLNKGKLYDTQVVRACLKVFYDRKFTFSGE